MQTVEQTHRPRKATPLVQPVASTIEDELVHLQRRYYAIATAALKTEARAADATLVVVSPEPCAKPLFEFGGVILRVIPPEITTEELVERARRYDEAAILQSFTAQLAGVMSGQETETLFFRNICPLGSATAERIVEAVSCYAFLGKFPTAQDVRKYIQP